MKNSKGMNECRTYFIDVDGRSKGQAGGGGAGEHTRDLEDKGSEG